VHRAGAERASSRGVTEIAGASHAITVSQPDAVTATILQAVEAVATRGVGGLELKAAGV
jgi:hypothetical protein